MQRRAWYLNVCLCPWIWLLLFLCDQMVFAKGFLSFEDKSRAINGDGVDSELADLINRWHKPGMNLYVGKPEYRMIIESVLVSICSLSCIVIFLNNFECLCSRDSFQKIPCRMCCQTVLEIMWGIQQQMRTLVPREKSKLTKEDRLPMSQGLRKFLSNRGYDVKLEMVSSLVGPDMLSDLGKVCFSTLNYHASPILALKLRNRTFYTSN